MFPLVDKGKWLGCDSADANGRRIVEHMFPLDLDGYDARATLVAMADVHALQGQADVAELRLALHFADLHPDPATVSGDVGVPGGERGIVHGGEGCPAIAEFAAAEFGVVTGRSAGAAARFIGECLALRHRLPRTLAQVMSGHAAVWKARKIASACLALSVEAAAIVDERVAGIIDSVTPLRLAHIVRAAMWQADPEAAQAAAEARARQRGVWAGRTDEHGTTMLFVRGNSGDVLRFDATIAQIADALAALGDTDSENQRRAKAIGVIADPALADKLLQVAQHLTTTSDSTTEPAEPAEPAEPTEPSESAEAPDIAGWAETGLVPDEADDDCSAANLAEPVDYGPEGDDFDDGSLHPSDSASDGYLLDLPEPLDAPEASDQADDARDSGRGMDWAARAELSRKIDAIRQVAYAGRRPRQTVLYTHITDETLLAGGGVARVEGFGPVFAAKLQELLGHDQVIVQPVIDLSIGDSVDAYEIPRRIREQVKLTYPVEQFPYGSAATTNSMDLDHIRPFDSTGPPGQTSTANLIPLRRFSHRAKTRGRWSSRRIDDHTVEWRTPNGFRFRVDRTGTHPVDDHD